MSFNGFKWFSQFDNVPTLINLHRSRKFYISADETYLEILLKDHINVPNGFVLQQFFWSYLYLKDKAAITAAAISKPQSVEIVKKKN